MVDPTGTPDCGVSTWASSQYVVTVNALPAAPDAITGGTATCSGTGVTFTQGTCNAGTCYWQTASGGTSVSNSNPTYTTSTAANTYTVYVRAKDANGCWSAEVTKSGTVKAAVNFGTVSNTGATICSGGDPASFGFSISPSGGAGTFNYQWYSYNGSTTAPTGTSVPGGWTAISPDGTNSIYDPPSGLTSTTTYACMVDPTGTPDCGVSTWTSSQYVVTVASVPTIALGANAPSATSQCKGTTKVIIQSFSITHCDGDLTQVNFTTTGTYVQADITKYQLWYRATTNCISGSSQLGTDLTSSGNAGSRSFTSLSPTLTNNTTYYFWITADVASSITNGHTIAVNAIATGDLTSSSTVAGSTTAGGTQTLNSGCAATYPGSTPDSTVVTFTYTGGTACPGGTTSYTWIAPCNVSAVRCLAVGGGGGGGSYGGGGGGGVVYNTAYTVFPGSSYVVIVGYGGQGNCGAAYAYGYNSSFNNDIIAIGGGGGGVSSGNWQGQPGGSGGGGWHTNGTSYSGGASTQTNSGGGIGYGNRGGNPASGAFGGCGGGGAGAHGGDVPSGQWAGSDGGAGKQFDIVVAGTFTYYAGGGGGKNGGMNGNGSGGSGGGGPYGTAGTNGLGGGGGSGYTNGGSGVVIIKYPTP